MAGCRSIISSFLCGMLVHVAIGRAADPQILSPELISQSIERSLPLLERASAGAADQRVCFTCHNQAIPVFALVEASKRGFHIDRKNFDRQIEHTYAHLKRGSTNYKEGKGQGGGVDTAGYALWTLEDGQRPADSVTDAVVDYVLSKQNSEGYWKHTSNRPPSEASSFTTTYLALRALSAYGRAADAAKIQQAKLRASTWLQQVQPVDNEDRVFRLLSTQYVDTPRSFVDLAVESVKGSQRADGGWSQLESLESDAYATATSLYALHRAGTGIDDPAWQRGLQYLTAHQMADGSWHVTSRSKPFQTYFESGYPHEKDQFISTAAAGWATLCLLMTLPTRDLPQIETLPNTQPIEWPEADLSGRMMFGAHRFVESEIERVHAARHKLKIRDEAHRHSLRSDLSKLLGVVEKRLPPRMETYGDDDNPALVASTDTYQVHQVRWPVFANVFGEGLRVRQLQSAKRACIVVPDANQSPEQLLGLVDGLAEDQQIARRLAAAGFDLIIPTIVSRDKLTTNDERLRRADMTQREWIYRQAFHMGRHIIGYEMQRVLAAVDWLNQKSNVECPIGIVGYGEGALLALHCAAIDERISATLVSGYFDSSDKTWAEPIYRQVWRRLKSFGNAEIASLISPRFLIVEHSPFPTAVGHKGALTTPTYEQVKREFERIQNSPPTSPNAGPSVPPILIGDKSGKLVGPWSDSALRSFLAQFSIDSSKALDSRPLKDGRLAARQEIESRQRRCVDQLETYTQHLVQQSEHVRDQAFLFAAMPEFNQRRWSTQRHHETTSHDRFVASSREYRERFATEAMGRFDRALAVPNARTRKVAETDKWTAYDVVLDVHDQLFAWGVIAIPKDLQPGERRPVVVCQHGRQGLPRDTLDRDNPAYNNFAGELANRGFVTFAPHNLYRGEDEYRWLNRKANAIGCTLFSFIIAAHDQILKWLASQPFVDSKKIAFYGLSYGGETAVRVPPILENYALSICSGDFNQWTRKVAATDQPFSFMNTIEWEMPYWNLGHTFDYAEMSYLMFPRPFMVERGHNDLVGRDQWVAHEFAKLRWLYAQFGLSDRVAIEFFQGGHSIHGTGTFDFLHQHLQWPKHPEINELDTNAANVPEK